jgi:enterochelin esterase-like enzyme
MHLDPICLVMLAAFACAAASLGGRSQPGTGPRPAPRPSVISPEVHPDGSVTFRLLLPQAGQVLVSGAFGERPMSRDEAGLWSVTVGPLEPELYEYSFVVDEIRMLDPANPEVKPQRSPTSSMVEVLGHPPLLHSFVPEVPHGTVRQHWYQSKALGRCRSLHLYLPAEYDQRTRTRYPVLYLLHGHGDTDGTWSRLGRAHVIADNLLARRRARPLIIAMPDGHAVFGPTYDRSANIAAFQRDLFEDIMPLVEAGYRIQEGPESCAIAGLSMGGGQALTIGLNGLDRFAWVGGMSSAVFNPEETLAPALADPSATNSDLRLLWIGCGEDDFLLEQNQQFDALLTRRGIQHTYRLTEGNHSWPVWRRYLGELLPLLFQG